MKRPLRSLAGCFILAWVLTWVTVVPLFHTHLPDTTDNWSVAHSGGAHTVFTQDLPGEYASFQHSPHHSPNLSQRAVNSPEFGLVLLEETTKARKTNRVPTLGASFWSPDPALLHRLPIIYPEGKRHRDRLYAVPPARAPPGGLCWSCLPTCLAVCPDADYQRGRLYAEHPARAPPH